MPTTTHAAPAAPSTTHQPKGFRPDVEGLRAIAVGTVLWFHAGLTGLTGGFAGVDIFFVISGFLITGQITREVERTGRISLSGSTPAAPNDSSPQPRRSWSPPPC